MSSGNEILDMYIYETNTLLEQLETIVLDAEKVDTFSQENVNEIFRIMHTIKGSSAMMEFDSLATVAHRIEDLFFIIRDNTMSVVSEDNRPALFDLVFQSIDYFRGEIEKVEGDEPLNKDIDSFLSNINTLISKIKGEEVPQEAAPPAPAPAEAAPAAAPAEGNSGFPYDLRVTFEEGCGMESLRAFMLVTSVRELCEDDAFCFDPANVENDPSTSEAITEHGFLMSFKRAEDRDNAISVVKSAGSVQDYQSLDHPVAPPPAPVEATAPAAAAAPAAAPAAPAAAPAAPAAQAQHPKDHPKETLISINLSKLDQLSAVVGEIVITESMVISSPDLKGLNLDAFSKSARQLRKLTDELQDVSMSLRMVPVSSVFQKMTRIVRDMTKKLDRPCKLTLIGENTEVDKTIVDNIGDPIMHMVRNSMDHGIEETQEERVAAGKDPVGEIVLSAQDTGSEVIIQIIDDGRGVNDEAVLAKAIRQGIASPDVEYSHRDILNFLLAPGFSTNAQVTEFSGRGVGMDVVRRNVEELGGNVSISSEMGRGMTTTIRIPLTMAIMDGMEVSVGDSIFTIPINNILSTMRISAQDVIHDSSRGELIKVQGNFYPIVRARDLYQLQSGCTEIEEGVLLWLEAGDNSYCLFVDELLGQQQVVVKQLPSYVNSYNIKNYGINGCTLLGDGSISIILDVANLYGAVRGM
ncbi:MAG: chemotaxis protein CheA [Ruminiclostridium sp.]|jgi:two-component system chemotaxis sensor kinase CheA|nr:chemotaxis protein CheA [Ruminiclostridium sp.]MCI9465508.1 chemotaxis protein CheA [Ruminiclostridium sp.]